SDTELHPESAEQRNQEFRTLSEPEKKSLLAAREAVWRAWFGGDERLSKSCCLRSCLPLVQAVANGRTARRFWTARRVLRRAAASWSASNSQEPRFKPTAQRRLCTQITSTNPKKRGSDPKSPGASPRFSCTITMDGLIRAGTWIRGSRCHRLRAMMKQSRLMRGHVRNRGRTI